VKTITAVLVLMACVGLAAQKKPAEKSSLDKGTYAATFWGAFEPPPCVIPEAIEVAGRCQFVITFTSGMFSDWRCAVKQNVNADQKTITCTWRKRETPPHHRP
jgi:hypothetical protein